MLDQSTVRKQSALFTTALILILNFVNDMYLVMQCSSFNIVWLVLPKYVEHNSCPHTSTYPLFTATITCYSAEVSGPIRSEIYTLRGAAYFYLAGNLQLQTASSVPIGWRSANCSSSSDLTKEAI